MASAGASKALVSEYGVGSGDATEAARRADKQAALDEAWKAKLAAREAAAAEREAAKLALKDPAQDSDAFNARLKALAASVEEGLAAAAAKSKESKDGLARGDLTERCNALVKVVDEMQAALAAATLFLPQYDVRAGQERISKLSAAIEQARMTLAPRKKFGFSAKGGASLSETPAALAAPAALPAAPAAPAGQTSRAETANKTDSERAAAAPRAAEALLAQLKLDGQLELLIEARPPGPVDITDVRPDQDVRFRELQHCQISIKRPSGAVRFINLKGCTVFCGPVAGSCFFENCHDCRFYIASRQVRIHDSTRSDFYLHVLSRPIIEHCSELRFAPYLLSYPALRAQIAQAGLEKKEAADMWKDVDDFRWLRQQQSPNWALLADADRVSHTVADTAAAPSESH
jgi:hypothetical protein